MADPGARIENAGALASRGERATRRDLLAVAEAALARVHPETAVPRALAREGASLVAGDACVALDAVERVRLVGAGKGAGAVVRALDPLLGDRLDGGVVATKAAPEPPRPIDAVETVVAGHPLPDAASLRAGRRALAVADDAGPDDLVLAVVTGGASALLAAPAGDLSLADLRATTDALLRAGLPIASVNAVRTHLSTLKGGRLADRIAPARLLTLVVVDEPAGEPWGPTVPARTSYADALAVLDGTDATVPAAVRDHLAAGAAGAHPEPAALPARGETVVLADAADACDAARDRAAALGYEPLVLSTTVEGESREVASAFAAVAREAADHGRPVSPPCLLVSGGETTVTVGDGGGTGGPNQEFALASALALADRPGLATLALGTDGTDGPTDVAGGLVDGSTLDRLAAAGIDPEARLREHDATPALTAAGDAVRTGPTGTNVMDLRLTAVPRPD